MSAPVSYSMPGAVAASGLSRSSLERAIRTGALRAKKTTTDKNGQPAGNWVITHAALQDFIDGLVDA